MSSMQWRLRNFVRRLSELDIKQSVQFHLSRNFSRRTLLVLCALFFVFYWFLFYSRNEIPPISQSCLAEKLRYYSLEAESASVGIGEDSVYFVGNGYIGVGEENELLLSSSRLLSTVTGFHPLVNIAVPEAVHIREETLTDFQNGTVKRFMCFQIQNSECACVIKTVYAHRTRSKLLIEEIHIINPTSKPLRVSLTRPRSPQWQTDMSVSENEVQYREFTDRENSVVAVLCSSAPNEITVQHKREESFRFTCSVERRLISKDRLATRKEASAAAVNAFAEAKGLSIELDKKHHEAWRELNAVSFSISHSRAPSVLNGVLINATRYALVSNVKALLIQEEVTEKERKDLEMSASRRDLCYTGHSTLLHPSRLWQKFRSSDEVLQMAELWWLTLEKRGCSTVMKTGAHGVIQAYVLSLAAGTFHDSHLEIGVDPADLHRELSVKGIEIAAGEKVSIEVRLDDENRPFLLVSSTMEVFACDAGCNDAPVQVGGGDIKEAVRLPVKITKPLTSILYVAMSRKHLTQLQSAIHVSAIDVAPAHEHDLIALHKHGARLGGLPTIFWATLGFVLVAFHVFLIKLLYSEWRKGDTMPYNPYLRQRYSYIRSH